jgi:membrane-associated protease RseP (regulator of RpoE activity)
VLKLDGRKVDSFADIRMGAALSDGTVRLKIQRDGKVLEDEIVVETTRDTREGIQTISADPVLTTEFLADGDPVGDLPYPLKGDQVTHVDGQPVADALDILDIIRRSQGRLLKFTVRRPDPEDPSAFRTVECYQRAVLSVVRADLDVEREGSPLDDCHILGLRRRLIVGDAERRSPAKKAGFERGDVIAAWGTVPNPLYSEMTESIQANVNKPTRVIVERAGQEVELTVTPKRPFKIFGEARARVGLEFPNRGEENRAVVADVAPNTPFAALNMPRGSLLLAIDGQPVSNWFEVVKVLAAAAGRSVDVRYRSGADEVTGRVDIPSSLVNELKLPPGAVVWAVDGERSVEVPGPNGRPVRMELANNPPALHALLKSKIGQTVTVRYSPTLTGAPREAPFTVRADNADPWQMRINYAFDVLVFSPKMEPVSAHGNPLIAIKMGTNYLFSQLWQVYTFLTKLADRSVSTQNVAGPVGIVGIAIERAKMGTGELMFFMAFLSVNLAVINFLPMPVMDGGLMVFLIIEKIKGKPLSLKAQMISTMVGLAAIVLIGLYVTIQDIGRFF